MSAPLARHPGASRLLPILAIVVAAMLRAAALGVGSGHLADDRDDYLVVARHYADEGFWTPFRGNSQFVPAAVVPPGHRRNSESRRRLGGVGAVATGPGNGDGRPHLAPRSAAGPRIAVDRRRRPGRSGPSADRIHDLSDDRDAFHFSRRASRDGRNAEPIAEPSNDGKRRWRAAGIGAVFGACALCRPTIWPVAGLAAAWLLWRSRQDTRSHPRPAVDRRRRRAGRGGRRLSLDAAELEDPGVAGSDDHARRIHAAVGKQRSVLPPGRGPSPVGRMARQQAGPLSAALVSGSRCRYGS